MDMIHLSEIENIIRDLENVIRELRRRNLIPDSRMVDEFFYLQKVEELRTLKSNLELLHLNIIKTNEHVSLSCSQICKALKKDSQYLQLPIKNEICERFSI